MKNRTKLLVSIIAVIGLCGVCGLAGAGLLFARAILFNQEISQPGQPVLPAALATPAITPGFQEPPSLPGLPDTGGEALAEENPQEAPAQPDQSYALIQAAFPETAGGDCEQSTADTSAGPIPSMDCFFTTNAGFVVSFEHHQDRAILDARIQGAENRYPGALAVPYTPAQGWVQAGPKGRVIEYTNDKGYAILMWTIDSQNMLAMALDLGGDTQAVRSWWASQGYPADLLSGSSSTGQQPPASNSTGLLTLNEYFEFIDDESCEIRDPSQTLIVEQISCYDEEHKVLVLFTRWETPQSVDAYAFSLAQIDGAVLDDWYFTTDDGQAGPTEGRLITFIDDEGDPSLVWTVKGQAMMGYAVLLDDTGDLEPLESWWAEHGAATAE